VSERAKAFRRAFADRLKREHTQPNFIALTCAAATARCTPDGSQEHVGTDRVAVAARPVRPREARDASNRSGACCFFQVGGREREESDQRERGAGVSSSCVRAVPPKTRFFVLPHRHVIALGHDWRLHDDDLGGGAYYKKNKTHKEEEFFFEDDENKTRSRRRRRPRGSTARRNKQSHR
jgi:hypothetical protein